MEPGEERLCFGPVPSRRLGLSLGIDLIPFKVCSFDCVYCQLGRTTMKTIERKEYKAVGGLEKELETFVEQGKTCDYVTFSGSGEPTLNSSLGRAVMIAKAATRLPVAVLTNGSLMMEEETREALSTADLVIPSLDSPIEDVFRKVNRPCNGLSIERIVSGMEEFSRHFGGEVWLEVMVVKGMNDGPSNVEALKDAITRIRPSKVQLNTPVRPPAEAGAGIVGKEMLEEMALLLGAEVIGDYEGKEGKTFSEREIEEEEKQILDLVQRRPCTLEDISRGSGMHLNQVAKHIRALHDEGRIEIVEMNGKRFCKARKDEKK